jgi:hypothetical protein
MSKTIEALIELEDDVKRVEAYERKAEHPHTKEAFSKLKCKLINWIELLEEERNGTN